MINSPFQGEGFNVFLSTISQPCIVLFDEFEKVYDKDSQPGLLTLLDGVFSGNKLFILTVNDVYKVDIHMRNRPGRLYYAMDFAGLSLEFIREYCQDTLNNQAHTDSILVISSMFEKFSFDMLQSLVEELNRYPGDTPTTVVDILNVKPNSRVLAKFDVSIRINGKIFEKADLSNPQWEGNPLADDDLQFYYANPIPDSKDNKDWEQWVNASFTTDDIVKLDISNGLYFFKNSKGEELILTKRVESKFDYRKYLDL